ncbi:HD domain-containing protein [Butyrivibrio fibrisolvens]|uniref:HD domain-containing protein n=1 Tax=Butyrivibrio fibrisolvens TaxID=831 RepID=UPI0004297B4B|nr:HD domain-containing protein [Butyrivibrio fibrisolvens]
MNHIDNKNYTEKINNIKSVNNNEAINNTGKIDYLEKINHIEHISRCQLIYDHPLYQAELVKIAGYESDRIFCRHTFEHFMDVARIAYIMNLEKGYKLSKEIIYAAALLHDIGRARQYEDGTPHDKAGAEIADKILSDCGFSDDEKNMIVAAIISHRVSVHESDIHKSDKYSEDTKNIVATILSTIIYKADKASRQCFRCNAQKECNWSMEKRNLKINI